MQSYTHGIDARVIADSLSPDGHRLTTLEVTMHRFVLAEFNTHRVFSRNSASSRAVPAPVMVRRSLTRTAVPVAWPQEKPGMQGGDDLPDAAAAQAHALWLSARDAAVAHAEELLRLGVHKSVVNRLLEPFLLTTVVVSSTMWAGFFWQRCSPLAQPEIRLAAERMREAYDASKPEPVYHGQWHLPYVTREDIEELAEHPEQLRAVSAARCARVSRETFDGRRDIEADLILYRRLITASPPHASPLEHVATPHEAPMFGNFSGWQQLRHLVLGAS